MEEFRAYTEQNKNILNYIYYWYKRGIIYKDVITQVYHDST